MQTFLDAPCHLLISDIRMPGMSGIEMLRALHKESSDFETIFLTGYDTFEYAYESIQENAFRYVLKNESDEKLLFTVDEAIVKISKQREFAAHIQKLHQDLSLLQAQYIRQTLRDLLLQQAVDVPEDLLGGRSVYLLLGYADGADNVEHTREIALQSIADGIRQSPKLDVCWQEQFTVRHDLVWLFSTRKPDVPQYEMYQVLSELQRLADAYVSNGILLVADYEPARVSELFERYLRLKRVKMFNLLLRNSGIANANQEEARQMEQIRQPMLLQQISAKVFMMLEDGQENDIVELAAPVFQFLEACVNAPGLTAWQIYYDFVNRLLSFIQQNHMDETFQPETGDILFRLNQPESFEGKVYQLRRGLERLIHIVHESEHFRIKDLSENVKRYVALHLHEDLCASMIAAQMGYSEAHLSRLFKESGGVTLHHFIQQSRMERARHMLKDSDEKIYRIAQLCGYRHTSYFIRVFKSAVGITPQEYRDECGVHPAADRYLLHNGGS